MSAKRTAAVLGSVLFCPALFLLLWAAVLYTPAEQSAVILGYPLLTAAYFLIASRIFQKKLGLRRLTLWLWMALPGYFLCWIFLLLWLPVLLQNGIILLLFLASVSVQIAVWLAVLLAEGVLWLLARKKTNSP